jgi:hypothetical protein
MEANKDYLEGESRDLNSASRPLLYGLGCAGFFVMAKKSEF